ncbi:MAG: leucine-rich repeat domain-containing protein [Bacteroidales bacterium]|nr:leucine-rich repeat domain-containing protein [Bacteroidales bacterium]
MMSNGGGNAGYEYAPWYNEEYRNSITSVIIEEGISNIGKYTFYQCNNIVSIIIPGSITDISSGATFTGCRKITKIINHRAIPQTIDSSVFEDIDKSNCTLIVPAGSENVYGAAEGWKDFVDIKPIQ